MDPEYWMDIISILEKKYTRHRATALILKANPSFSKKAEINDDSNMFGSLVLTYVSAMAILYYKLLVLFK